jgi:hypothetical protein
MYRSNGGIHGGTNCHSARRSIRSSPAIATLPQELHVNHRFLFAATIALTSCATAVSYETVLSSWMGAPEMDLVRSWGPPSKTYEIGDHKFFIYESSRNMHLPGTATFSTGTTIIAGSPEMDVSIRCTTTFELRNSAIVASSYEGAGCGSMRGASSRRY